jgi:hypothetical protein
MHGDFSRISFQPDKEFLRVLLLQGRPLLEADSNEQTAILLHYLQALAANILGPYAAIDTDAFRIENAADGLLIHPGIMYVNGIRVINEGVPQENDDTGPIKFDEQPYYEVTGALEGAVLIYLDVFERVVFPEEDPSFAEPALNGTTTSLRTRLIWQVKAEIDLPPGVKLPANRNAALTNWPDWVNMWQPDERGTLNVQLKAGTGKGAAPCKIPSDAAYRGLHNQLYRVEVHTGGNAEQATFKWSKENGATVVGAQPLAEGVPPSAVITPQYPQVVDWSQWTKDTWVEILTEDNLNKCTPGLLTQIVAAPRKENQIVLADAPSGPVTMLRRWDTIFDLARRDGLTQSPDDNAAVIEGAKWLPLENGIEVQFSATGIYRTGDYWLIPARTGTDQLIWEKNGDQYVAQLPHGITHHYAPLAVLRANGNVVELRFILARSNLFS